MKADLVTIIGEIDNPKFKEKLTKMGELSHYGFCQLLAQMQSHSDYPKPKFEDVVKLGESFFRNYTNQEFRVICGILSEPYYHEVIENCDEWPEYIDIRHLDNTEWFILNHVGILGQDIGNILRYAQDIYMLPLDDAIHNLLELFDNNEDLYTFCRNLLLYEWEKIDCLTQIF